MTAQRSTRKPLTLKDVAKATGFSASTVSAAFSNRPDQRHRESTLIKVREAAQKLGFRVNRQARLLRGGKSQTLLLAKSVSIHQITVEMTMAVQEAVGAEQYHLISTEMMPAMDVEQVINTVADFRVDGVILQNVLSGSVLSPLISECHRIGVKMVSIEGERLDGVPFFISDYWQGYDDLYNHLIAQGARRIALAVINCDMDNPSQWRTRVAMEKFEEKVIRKRGRVKGEIVPIPMGESFRNDPIRRMQHKYFTPGYTIMRELLGRKQRPDAVVFLSDLFAINALKACIEANVSVPGEMMIAGCDSSGFGQSVSPTLTSLRLPFEETSRQAVKALIAGIEGREDSLPENSMMSFPMELVVGGSTLRK